VDVYLDSPAEKLMHEVLSRGGAIGGSSAGATIQGEYLVRGNPLGNMQMMAEGYERGFGFLKGVAIDQHFVKRNRFADMTAFKKAFPQVLGLGIDEGAALVVTGHTLEVVGLGQVCIYDVRQPAEGQPDYVAVKSGEKFDLSTLKK
jgi:cyanophycinase